MTQRERMLSILVGGLLVSLVLWWGFGNYRSAVRSRLNQIDSLRNEKQQLTEYTLQGEYANRQMGEYLIRSLPSNTERARSEYNAWLLRLVQEHRLSDSVVDFNSSPLQGLYRRLSFNVSGRTDMQGFIGMLHSFHAKDYLHRIRSFTFSPNRQGDFTLDLKIDAIALVDAKSDLPPRADIAWRVDLELDNYLDPIMNRNFFKPPNEAPQFTGRPELEAIVGRNSPIQLTFRDPEEHSISFELVDPPPASVRLDRRTGTLWVNSDEQQEFDVTVRAIDQGYPRRSTEQHLIVKVVPPPPEPPPKLAFDDATQTVLTALVHGRDEWTAWMHVRTRDKTLRLQVGDSFEIGSLKGTVVDVTPRYAMLEIDGRRFTLKPAGNLSEAANLAQED